MNYVVRGVNGTGLGCCGGGGWGGERAGDTSGEMRRDMATAA